MIVIGQGLIRKETFEQDLFSIIQQGNGVSEYFFIPFQRSRICQRRTSASSFKWIYSDSNQVEDGWLFFFHKIQNRDSCVRKGMGNINIFASYTLKSVELSKKKKEAISCEKKICIGIIRENSQNLRVFLKNLSPSSVQSLK